MVKRRSVYRSKHDLVTVARSYLSTLRRDCYRLPAKLSTLLATSLSSASEHEAGHYRTPTAASRPAPPSI